MRELKCSRQRHDKWDIIFRGEGTLAVDWIRRRGGCGVCILGVGGFGKGTSGDSTGQGGVVVDVEFEEVEEGIGYEVDCAV